MIPTMPESYQNPRKVGYKVNPLADPVKPETKLERENRIAGNYFTAFASVGTALLGLAADVAIRTPDILLNTNYTMTTFLGQIGQFIASHPIEAPLFMAVGAVIPPLYRLIRG